MSSPVGLGNSSLPPSPPQNRLNEGMRIPLETGTGGNILSAPTTPGHRVSVVDRTKADPQVVKAAEGMEAMFLDYMMKVMRETVPKNEMDLESPATGIYRSMMDSETAQKAARSGGIGLADQIIAYLDPQRYNLEKRPPEVKSREVAQKGYGVPISADPIQGRDNRSRVGGDHEGQPIRK